MDPIELRLKNFTSIHPESKLPFSDNNLKELYAYGKQKIGWDKRPAIPGSLKENGMLIGYGMSVGAWGSGKGMASVRAVFSLEGNLLLECAVSDMGPGTTTSMTMIAADNMKMPIEKVKFKLGDSDLPPGPSQGGSGTTSTVGSAVVKACETLKQQILDLAIQFVPEFNGKAANDLMIKNEQVYLKSDEPVHVSIQTILQKANKKNIELTIVSTPKSADQIKHAYITYSAHFVKLAVHPTTGAIKILQVVTTGDAGKIISPKTAKSQMLGGVVGGIGMALTEKVIVDHQTGQIINASFGAYHIPTNSQIPPTDVWFVNKPDLFVNDMGAKGIGEIALIGFAAAITNAAYNATGKRVRDLPITPEKMGFKKTS